MERTRIADHSIAVNTSFGRILQASFAALLGIVLFLGVALSHPDMVHNAAHDARHGIAVPCH